MIPVKFRAICVSAAGGCRTIALAVLAAQCCPGFVFAGSAQGASAFQFLQLGVGARPSAMGEVFAGVAGDVNAVYWNPAGLAALERGEVSMTHALWLEDITYSNIAYGRPALGGSIGAAFNILNTGAIQKADNNGLRLADNYSMSDMFGQVSYARAWGNLALGTNLKYISSRIEEESAHSYAADFGALYSGFRLWGRRLNAGAAVQNLGTKARYVSEENPLPVITRAGVSLELSKSLLLASDMNYTEKDASFRAGAEYTRKLGELLLAARAGYKTDTVKELGALSGLTAGMGIKWSDYQLDYAWNSFTDLGITHRLSLGIKFGYPDSDDDGVADRSDKCPGTSKGTAVDAAGCPLDTDADGVTNHLDKCPDTPKGVAVDAAGCPLDTDADGVADYLDKCPDTPKGVAVDAAGCPPDSDGDGVADHQDKCPGTPKGTVVDELGCPLLADADSDIDSYAFADADADGVPDPVTIMEFEYDSAAFRSGFAVRLHAIEVYMAANPGALIELQGYTDDHGADDYNFSLSERRAGAVLKYFVKVIGIDAGRLSARGMGKANPAASNRTEEGRQRNRRVVVVFPGK